MTKCAVSAVSVVLIPQMCRSCNSRDALDWLVQKGASTLVASIPGWTAFIAMLRLPRSRLQVPQTIMSVDH